MTKEETQAFVDKFMASFDVGDMNAIASFYASDYVNRTPYPGAADDFAGHNAFVTAASPFLEFVSSDTIETIVGEGTATILSSNRFRIRESGEEFDAFGYAVIKLRDGLIVENWGGYDVVAAFKMFNAGVSVNADA